MANIFGNVHKFFINFFIWYSSLSHYENLNCIYFVNCARKFATWKISYLLLGGPENSFHGLTSHSLALQYLSHNLASSPSNPLMSSPHILQQLNGSNHYHTTSASQNLLLPSLSTKHSNNFPNISSQVHVESPDSHDLMHTSKEQDRESSLTTTKSEAQSVSSPSHHSPIPMESTDGAANNIRHLPQPPYGLSHEL